MFEGLVATMQQARAAAFEATPGPSSIAAVPSPAQPPRAAEREAPPPVPTFERLVVPAKSPAKPEGHDVVVVHVLEDIPPFAGLYTSYRLRKEDIVTLPRGIARVLIDRGKARLVQLSGGA